jgi:hypothetical protein
MSILHKVVYRLNVVLMKMLIEFFTELKKKFLKFVTTGYQVTNNTH